MDPDALPDLQTNVTGYTFFMTHAGSTFLETTQHFFSICSLKRLPLASTPDRILCIFLAFLILVLLLRPSATSSHKSNKAHQISLDATQALSVVLTPTSVSWPPAFIAHFSSTKTNGQRLELSLSELFDHIFQGRIEVRNYCDLPDLFRGLWAYGWCIKIGLDRHWYFKTAKWLATQHMLSACKDVSLSRNF
jgi:hypothetical protein